MHLHQQHFGVDKVSIHSSKKTNPGVAPRSHNTLSCLSVWVRTTTPPKKNPLNYLARASVAFSRQAQKQVINIASEQRLTILNFRSYFDGGLLFSPVSEETEETEGHPGF